VTRASMAWAQRRDDGQCRSARQPAKPGQRSPSSFRPEVQPAAENWSWASVASSGSTHHGGRRGRLYRWLQASALTDLA
jgi:hypothetical protein